ncbi:hypothetical protein T265_08160 [Opisthorchis viverrini]|uniref:Uncharacterized protein n=1 Tax=Opisthorchis viverrini TaxID=6198 RepID=A0A074ZA37_OPIVI|nr:hypothetical protein T265_08160 [Opisthorchis viverrini]KER24121.1 hypothetical protein T265_08160 [Opisthorchis viverrini]
MGKQSCLSPTPTGYFGGQRERTDCSSRAKSHAVREMMTMPTYDPIDRRGRLFLAARINVSRVGEEESNTWLDLLI